LRFTNGIAFGSDGCLYVNESLTGNVHRYNLDGTRRREEFANVVDPDGPRTDWHGPDGMCFSSDGRLWVTVFGQSHVAVVDREGVVVDRLRLEGSGPTNAAFGPAGEGRLYVVETELGRMEAHEVGVDGLPLHG
jgi:gluconolactonase